MNYLTEIIAFNDWLPFNSIPADAQALWYALMYFNNKCAVQIDGTWYWRVEFSVPNRLLLSHLDFSQSQLDRMRNVLIQAGRIRYRKGKGNRSGTYSLIPFDTHYGKQPGEQVGKQPGEQPGVQVWVKQGTLINNNNKHNTNLFSGGGGFAGARGGELEDFLDTQVLGLTDANKQQAQHVAQELFSKYTTRAPTMQDVAMVLQYAARSDYEAGKLRLTFPDDTMDLLRYAFQKAAESGKGGQWPYISAVLARLNQRGIFTLADAEAYDDQR